MEQLHEGPVLHTGIKQEQKIYGCHDCAANSATEDMTNFTEWDLMTIVMLPSQ
jgi:hypothetical protein